MFRIDYLPNDDLCKLVDNGVTMPKKGQRVLALYKGEWIVLEVAVEHPTYEENFTAFKYWFEPFSDHLIIEYDDVTEWRELPDKGGI